jgi:hypothetical protein
MGYDCRSEKGGAVRSAVVHGASGRAGHGNVSSGPRLYPPPSAGVVQWGGYPDSQVRVLRPHPSSCGSFTAVQGVVSYVRSGLRPAPSRIEVSSRCRTSYDGLSLNSRGRFAPSC